ncbi:protein EI24 homolog isoform X1 [Ziziphus jujuba]|uniref:Protein EI24 homolog isoform X1 n=1 Tax=Ziziphus jujuba TaxID=326968 RepID=A0ABM3I9G3_ZIZJJ|nr:protein EI24 homolog isoform X1 [Ziziphus jujuba]XP_060667681.1 protein EI24 homolog isoform X1 [Ziziphus jujuba]
MEGKMELVKSVSSKLKEASLFWLLGFKEACRLHRVLFLCLSSRRLLRRTGQCFLLNGFLFLGSIFILNAVIIPALEWILPDDCSKFNSQLFCSFASLLKFYSFLRLRLIQLFYVTWFYPLYVFSFILSNIWYNDIANYGFAAMGTSGPAKGDPLGKNESLTVKDRDRMEGLGGVMIGIGEQVYSVLLLTFFFLEVYVTGFVPYMGKILNFLLLSWMYAYYCFEYKWNLSEVGLDRRLDFFESNWAFFAGFGSPCVLPVLFSSPLVSYGIMAILFPLFVLAATDSAAEHVIYSRRRKWGGAGLGRLPIFYAADTLSLKVLSLLSAKSQEQLQDNKTL